MKNTGNISINRKASFEYDLIDKYEAGMVLKGTEVKSIRENRVNIKESYIRVKNNEIFIIGMNISEYSHQGYAGHNPTRERKLLLNRKEIAKIKQEVDEKGKTLVPIKLYFKNGIIKIQFAVAKGRKNRDKRNYKKDKEIKREIDRGLKGKR